MNRLLFILSLLFVVTTGYSQAASRVANAIATPTVNHDPDVVLSCLPTPNAEFRVIIKDSIQWEAYQINNLTDSIQSVGGDLYYPLTNPDNYVSGDGTASEYIKGDGTKAIFPTIPSAQQDSDWNSVVSPTRILNKPTIPAAQVNSDWNAVSGVQQVLNKPTIPAAQVNSDWSAVSGVTQILNKPTIPAAQIQSDWTQTNTGALDYIKNKPIPDYYNTVAVAGGAGNAVFYLTSDKTSGGTALYTTIDYVNPIVNDSTVNYSYGWSYNAGTKALTVNTKNAVGLNIALLGLTLLGVPSNVANGVNVQVFVKGH